MIMGCANQLEIMWLCIGSCNTCALEAHAAFDTYTIHHSMTVDEQRVDDERLLLFTCVEYLYISTAEAITLCISNLYFQYKAYNGNCKGIKETSKYNPPAWLFCLLGFT